MKQGIDSQKLVLAQERERQQNAKQAQADVAPKVHGALTIAGAVNF